LASVARRAGTGAHVVDDHLHDIDELVNQQKSGPWPLICSLIFIK
jgi:hypothetical protein